MIRKYSMIYCVVFGLFMVVNMLSFEDIAPGVSYSHITKEYPRPLSLHIVEIKNNYTRCYLEHAIGGGLSREPISSIGERVDALIAVNTGNYRRGGQFNGNAVGFFKINDLIYADPKINRSLLCMNTDNQIEIKQYQSLWEFFIGKLIFPVDCINQPRGCTNRVIYNSLFGSSTLTSNKGVEIVISQNKIVSINLNKGNSCIPDDGFVYSTQDVSGYDFTTLNVGDEVKLSSLFKPFSSTHYAVTGAGLLIKDGKIVNDFHDDFVNDAPIVHSGDEIAADFYNDKERAWLIEERHPRTALGIKTDQTIVILVVDGRQSGVSEGMNFTELAEYLYSLDCVNAINLGGGGCTTLYIKDKGVVNIPAVIFDTERVNTSYCNERPVSDALVIVGR